MRRKVIAPVVHPRWSSTPSCAPGSYQPAGSSGSATGSERCPEPEPNRCRAGARTAARADPYALARKQPDLRGGPRTSEMYEKLRAAHGTGTRGRANRRHLSLFAKVAVSSGPYPWSMDHQEAVAADTPPDDVLRCVTSCALRRMYELLPGSDRGSS